MLHSHLKSPGIFWQRPLTQMSSKVHSSMSVKETERGRKREREGPSCEGLVDHGIMVENWQPAIGSEGRSPLLKNDSSGAKNAQTHPDRRTHTL